MYIYKQFYSLSSGLQWAVPEKNPNRGDEYSDFQGY